MALSWQRTTLGAFAVLVVAPLVLLDTWNGVKDEWISGLTDQRGGNCCDYADGTRLEDPDWEYDGTTYKVRLDAMWYEVPEKAIVRDTNRLGFAIVWRYRDSDNDWRIRCFLPGAGT